MESLAVYFVGNKSDDYGNSNLELVETTLKNAKEYYWYKIIEPEDIPTLRKYFDLVEYEEEKERSDDNRFYGNE